MKDYKVAIHAEGVIWVVAENSDAALAQAEGYYGIGDCSFPVTSYEVVGDGD